MSGTDEPSTGVLSIQDGEDAMQDNRKTGPCGAEARNAAKMEKPDAIEPDAIESGAAPRASDMDEKPEPVVPENKSDLRW